MGNFIAQRKHPCYVVRYLTAFNANICCFISHSTRLHERSRVSWALQVKFWRHFLLKFFEFLSGWRKTKDRQSWCWLHFKQIEHFPTTKLALFTYETRRHDNDNNNNNTETERVKFLCVTKNINNEWIHLTFVSLTSYNEYENIKSLSTKVNSFLSDVHVISSNIWKS